MLSISSSTAHSSPHKPSERLIHHIKPPSENIAGDLNHDGDSGRINADNSSGDGEHKFDVEKRENDNFVRVITEECDGGIQNAMQTRNVSGLVLTCAELARSRQRRLWLLRTLLDEDSSKV